MSQHVRRVTGELRAPGAWAVLVVSRARARRTGARSLRSSLSRLSSSTASFSSVSATPSSTDSHFIAFLRRSAASSPSTSRSPLRRAQLFEPSCRAGSGSFDHTLLSARMSWHLDVPGFLFGQRFEPALIFAEESVACRFRRSTRPWSRPGPASSSSNSVRADTGENNL